MSNLLKNNVQTKLFTHLFINFIYKQIQKHYMNFKQIFMTQLLSNYKSFNYNNIFNIFLNFQTLNLI